MGTCFFYIKTGIVLYSVLSVSLELITIFKKIFDSFWMSVVFSIYSTIIEKYAKKLTKVVKICKIPYKQTY